MIERIAAALYGNSARFKSSTWETADEETKAYWRERASAAIEALGKPYELHRLKILACDYGMKPDHAAALVAAMYHLGLRIFERVPEAAERAL